jgi:DNA-directed RNA polymerase sigma subunit (sigma70/sigma32)
MKTTYLVKKNPNQPASNENWIIMDGQQFYAFKHTEEGKKRSNNFVKMCSEHDEECIVIECDPGKAARYRAEINHSIYVDTVNKKSGYQTVSYHLFDSEEEELCGEDMLEDDSESIEDMVMNKMQIDRLLDIIESMEESDRKIIYSFYYTERPMTEAAYAKENGISQQLVNYRKERAVMRLKKLYFS